MGEKTREVVWHQPAVTVDDRRELYDFRSCVIWFTGLPAAGKSTVANALNERFHRMGVMSYVLDGDNIRHGLNKDLGFGPEDRKENIRRIGEVAHLFVDAGLVAMTAFISPYREDRHSARCLVEEGEFVEVYVKCALEECERRDPKGMYKKARSGTIKDFTGISAPYEHPERPELILETDKMTVKDCIDEILDYLVQHDYIKQSRLDRT